MDFTSPCQSYTGYKLSNDFSHKSKYSFGKKVCSYHATVTHLVETIKLLKLCVNEGPEETAVNPHNQCYVL